MLRYSPKRSSRLINVVSEWSKRIEREINQEDKFSFVFAFFLRDPSDDNLHICLDKNTIPINTDDEEIRRKWGTLLDENERKKFLEYIKSKRKKGDRYLEIIEKELSDSTGKEFTTTLLALLHSFPYPMTQKIKENSEVYSCVDDRLYYMELFDNKSISKFVNVFMLPKDGQLPDFKIEDETVIYSQNPTNIAKDKKHKEALNTFLKIYSFVSQLPQFENNFPGFLMPIRNGRNNNEGSILGFINFACNSTSLRNRSRKFLSQKIELIHFQVNDAFLEGTLFEIEHGLEKIVNKSLLPLVKSNLKKMIFVKKKYTKNTKSLDLVINYKTDIPYELRRTSSSLEVFKRVGKVPIAQCVCPFVGSTCKEGCEDYQKGKIIELIIRLAQIKQNQKEIQKETIKHGTRAAVSAIMSRNMSHNIGSHVLSYWGSKLNNKIDNEINISYEDLEHSKILFDYLKQRMDFIAEISTTVPAWEKTLSFKNDIIGNFNEQFALLDNIALSEGFCYATEDCKKKTSSSTNNLFCSKLKCDRLPINLENLENLENKSLFKTEPEPMEIVYSGDDFPVAISHGVVGKQAFYSILENFIRNSAKHGGEFVRTQIKRERDKYANNESYSMVIDSLKFIIKAEDGGTAYPDYVKITISDNVGNCNEKNEKGERVIDILSKSMEDRKYIKPESGRIKKGSWGIKEMKVSANFLRKRDVETLISEKNNASNVPPLLQLNCYSNCKGNNKKCTKEPIDANVNITFYLRKPQEVCIVDDIKGKIKENKKHGIYVYSKDEFKNKLINGKTIPHRFLVFNVDDGDDIEYFMKNYREQLPLRIINNGKNVETDKPKNIWLNSVYTSINFDSIEKKPKKFILDLYNRFVTAKMGSVPKILIRVDESSECQKWAENDICITSSRLQKTNDFIVLDNHYEMTKNNNPIPETQYYQGFSGSTSFGKFLENVPSDKTDKKIVLKELQEAALVRVLIADERIWRNSQYHESTSGKDRVELLKAMGIILVPVNDNTIDRDEKERILNGKYKNIIIFVIHKGLVEKMDDSTFIKNVAEKFPYVIIDSGRGEPEDIDPGTRYVPMGAIESFLEEMDKYSLVQTLFSVRRFKNAKRE
jgi:hypothetical protein